MLRMGTTKEARSLCRAGVLPNIAAFCLLLAGTFGLGAQIGTAQDRPAAEKSGGDTAVGREGDDPMRADGGLNEVSAQPAVTMCEVDIPGECADAGLDAAACIVFYRTRIQDTRDILSRTLDFCAQTGATSSQQDAEKQIARLADEVQRLEADLARTRDTHRQELLELREEYTTRIADGLARIDTLIDERGSLAAELAALRDSKGEDTPDGRRETDIAPDAGEVGPQHDDDVPPNNIQGAPPETEPDTAIDPDEPDVARSSTPLSDIPNLGRLLMDETTVPEDVLPIDRICASPAPGMSDVEAALAAAPQIFDDLSPIQRARVIQGIASGTKAMEVVALAWRSAVRSDHIEARRTAAAHLCQLLSFSCIEGSDRARLCK